VSRNTYAKRDSDVTLPKSEFQSPSPAVITAGPQFLR